MKKFKNIADLEIINFALHGVLNWISSLEDEKELNPDAFCEADQLRLEMLYRQFDELFERFIILEKKFGFIPF